MKMIKRFFWRLVYQLYTWVIPPYKTLVVEENLPKPLKKGVIYIVQEDGFEEQAAMLCPCGCGKVLHMNLIPDEKPCWRVQQHQDGTTSLHPSIWRQKDCRSHFWFREGRVYWCDGHGSWWQKYVQSIHRR